MLKNEYQHNKRFREYVDKHCEEYCCNVEEALTHDEVKAAYRYYTEV